jgi:hypothetical protein
MAISEAKRRANAKWDSANLTIVGCRVRRDKAEEFKAVCKAAGTTPNAVFLEAMNDFMERHKEKGPEA